MILSYGICGELTLGAAAVGMSHYLRDLENARGTVALATAAMAITGAVGVGVCVGIARLTKYSSAAGVILSYVLVVGALMTAGIAAAWRRSRPPGTGPLHAPGSGHPPRTGRRLRSTTTNDTKPHLLALTAIGVLGGIVGYLLLLAIAGGRFDFVNQCYLQADGLTTCTDPIPRSYWVDMTAAGIGALMALGATYVVATRPRTPEGTSYA